MSVFRIIKDKNFTTVSNDYLRDKKLSLKAKGILTVMLSLPEDWDYSVNGLVAICKEGRSAVESSLSELKKYGYLEVIKLKPNESESGRFEYIYNVYESLKTRAEKQDPYFLPLEKDQQLNTKERKTKTNKKINKKSRTVDLKTTDEKYIFSGACIVAFNEELGKNYSVLPRYIADYLESVAMNYEIDDVAKMIRYKADYFNAIKKPENINPSTFFRETNFPRYMDEYLNSEHQELSIFDGYE